MSNSYFSIFLKSYQKKGDVMPGILAGRDMPLFAETCFLTDKKGYIKEMRI